MQDTTKPNKYAIHEACREGHLQTVESLLSASPKLTLVTDPDSRLPLHWATTSASLAIATLLLQHTPSLDTHIDASDSSGWTALMIASSLPSSSGLPLASLLLSRGADPNAKSHGGQTALHFAASKANLDVIRALLDGGASARIRDRRGQLPLHRAAAVGSVPVLRELLGKGKSAVDVADADGMTALHHAVCEGHGDAALFLVVGGAADAGKRDGEGRTALECAPDAKTGEFLVRGAEREGVDLV
ncbi:unnamed protein product [Periconia digitata]|uniref:Uncharacterized protein n=1 Tax=Periconia digitata TaxID=1303443 RepID=A0A9W4XVA2_9PLEO|nr:unnamed protein product [Periconia digitata]